MVGRKNVKLPEPVWLNLDTTTISRKRHGTAFGKPQILLNYARVSREAWRLKALVDMKGHPVTSRFLVYRARRSDLSLYVLWAVCNSPLANAYSYSHSGKRDVLSGTMLKLPVFPAGKDFTALESVVAAYFRAAKGARAPDKKAKPPTNRDAVQMALPLPGEENPPATTTEEELKYLHWRIDAEVLRLYDLPATTERQILEIFTGVRRRGVPFVQDWYFPKGFHHLDRLSELLAITADWTPTNKRRVDLIRRDVKGRLTDAEKEELAQLEHLTDARIALTDLLSPAPEDEIAKTVTRLKREGRWPE